ncbi:MAG: hypothetical protein ACK40O_11545, partial [Allosphingosinicella sp.]
ALTPILSEHLFTKLELDHEAFVPDNVALQTQEGELSSQYERLRGGGEILGTRQSGEAQFRLATPELVQELVPAATDDARLLVDRDGGLEGERGKAARLLLYLMERDAAVATLRSG